MITASIVLYNQNPTILKKTVDSFLNTPINKKLFLIDNSKNPVLKEHFKNKDIEYLFVGKNIGFGSAHNLIIDKITSDFHLILNPDVEFEKTVIPQLIQKLASDHTSAFISPKVLSSDFSLQFICRKHPTLVDLVNRKIRFSKKLLQKNQYQNKSLDKSFYPEFIHGCFMLFKTKDFIQLSGFDERYFLYLEDADICRKIEYISKKTLYFPEVCIIHHHQKGSSKELKLFFHHLFSAIKYFLKWGF